jgi:hypothetical protein
MERPQDPKVEPLFAALEDGGAERRGGARSGLLWKLVAAALVLAGLLAVVLHQAF